MSCELAKKENFRGFAADVISGGAGVARACAAILVVSGGGHLSKRTLVAAAQVLCVFVM